jgi:hypothetical protein
MVCKVFQHRGYEGRGPLMMIGRTQLMRKYMEGGREVGKAQKFI